MQKKSKTRINPEQINWVPLTWQNQDVVVRCYYGQYFASVTFNRGSTLYDIEDLQPDKLGLIRQKWVYVSYPVDGRTRADYIHCLESFGGSHVRTTTHMISYTWGYRFDIFLYACQFFKTNKLSTETAYIWICAFCNN